MFKKIHTVLKKTSMLDIYPRTSKTAQNYCGLWKSEENLLCPVKEKDLTKLDF